MLIYVKVRYNINLKIYWLYNFKKDKIRKYKEKVFIKRHNNMLVFFTLNLPN